MPPIRSIGPHVREWLRRYLPAEIVGLLAALGGALLAYRTTASPVVAAFAGSMCEAAGFYATVGWRDAVRHYGAQPGRPMARRMPVAAARTARDLAIEFGAAEIVDGVVARPALMYLGPVLTGHFLGGTLLGKLAADVAFYGLAITGYELRKRVIHQTRASPGG